MDSEERRLRDQLHALDRLEFELTEQDTLIIEQVKRSPDNAVPDSQRDLLWKLFQEVVDLGIGYSLPTVMSDNPDSLRPEIRSARSKVIWDKKRINAVLGSTEAQPSVPPSPQKPNRKGDKKVFRTALGEYHDLGIIGEGANGMVHRVRDVAGRQYALKLLRRELLGGTKQLRFQHELSFCMRASHPNVISVLDHGLFDEDIPFFVMPVFESTLRKTIERGIAPSTVPAILRQLALALEFAHAQGITHRDLKPENILCDGDVTSVVIADFGIAHFRSDVLLAAVETGNQERMANFVYAAPEQRTRGATVGTASDIYALGLIANELFTGHVPLSRAHPLISAVAREYGYLDNVVDSMLQYSPEQRPTAAALKEQFSPDRERVSPEAVELESTHHVTEGRSRESNTARGSEATPSVAAPKGIKDAGSAEPPRLKVLAAEASEFWDQRKLIADSAIQKEIWKRPRWRIWIHPIDFKKARFKSAEQCREFMVSSYVLVKGWMPYPWFSVDAVEVQEEWVTGEINQSDGRMRRIERWSLFRSGQFVHNRAFDEINDLGDRIHVLEIIDTVTGAYELAARLAKRGVLRPAAQLKFELFGVSGRELTWPLDLFGSADVINTESWAQDDEFAVIRQETVTDLETRARELALDAALEVFEKFGWSDPPKEKLAEEQGKRFSMP